MTISERCICGAWMMKNYKNEDLKPQDHHPTCPVYLNWVHESTRVVVKEEEK